MRTQWTREARVRQYFKDKGIWDVTFEAEAELQEHALEFLRMMPATQVIRKEASTIAGIADLLICHKGYFIAIELKDDIGATSPQQDMFLAAINRAEGIAVVCRTLSEIDLALKTATNAKQVI